MLVAEEDLGGLGFDLGNPGEFGKGAIVGALEVLLVPEELIDDARAAEIGEEKLGVGQGGGFLAKGFPGILVQLTVTAEVPIGVEHGIDALALLDGFGFEAGGVVGGEGVELRLVLGRENFDGGEAVLERIHAGSGFAFRGARPSRALGVAAIGIDLSLCGHGVEVDLRFQDGTGMGWGPKLGGVSDWR